MQCENAMPLPEHSNYHGKLNATALKQLAGSSQMSVSYMTYAQLIYGHKFIATIQQNVTQHSADKCVDMHT